MRIITSCTYKVIADFPIQIVSAYWSSETSYSKLQWIIWENTTEKAEKSFKEKPDKVIAANYGAEWRLESIHSPAFGITWLYYLK